MKKLTNLEKVLYTINTLSHEEWQQLPPAVQDWYNAGARALKQKGSIIELTPVKLLPALDLDWPWEHYLC